MTIRNIIIYVLIFTAEIFSQSDTLVKKTPEIELPDFVITKISQVELPTQTKEAPEVLNPLSPEFILPRISNENLSLEGLTDPNKISAPIIDSLNVNNFRLLAGAGRYKLPYAELFLQQFLDAKNKFYLFAKLDNQTAYIQNSEYLNLLLEGGTSFIFKKYSDAPARIMLNGGFEKFQFSPFASLTDNTTRSYNNIFVKAQMENLFYREFNINLGGLSQYQTYTSGTNQFLMINPFIEGRTEFEHFSLFLKGEPALVKIFGDHSDWDFFFPVSGEIRLKKIADFLNLSSKVEFQNNDGKDNIYFAPSLKADFLLAQNVILSLFYQNSLNIQTPIDLLRINKYLDTASYGYNLFKTQNKSGLSGIFYLDRFNTIEVSFSVYELNNFSLFKNSTQSGYFNTFKADLTATELKTIFIFNFNSLSLLNGEFKWQNMKFKGSDLKAPYIPDLSFNLNFSHNFNFLLYLGLRFSYYNKLFIDSLNKEEISSKINLSLFGEYLISKTFKIGLELNNLLNRENKIWYNYQEKPFDVLTYIKLNF